MKKEKPEGLYTHVLRTKINDYEPENECAISHGTRISATSASSDKVRLKSGYNRFDTEFHRPEDRIPTNHKEIIQLVQSIYKKNGLIRNIIDLMSDFASEGLDLRHPVKSQERFYKEWAKRVNLQSRSHDFMRFLMRDANVVIRRKMATISKPLAKDMSKANDIFLETVDETKTAEKPQKVTLEKDSSQKRTIPWGYTFISPSVVEKISGPVGKFFGDNSLAMRIPVELQNSIKSPKTDAEKEFIKKIPAEVLKAVKSGSNLVALDPDRIYIEYYKKDDWEDWGTPFLMGVIEDVLLKDKMKQADMAALDGVINSIRLWKLGNSDKQILPTKAAVNKLLGILQYNSGGGVMDIVWDDMIDFKTEYPPIDKILGPQKYTSVDRDIIKGIGIPDALVGGTDLGTRNAGTGFIQLKTLVERLEYIRSKCIQWIENELKIVAKAMGFKRIPNVIFETMSLRDETAEKQLMIQLLDRNIVSIETIHKVFGNDFTIELENLKLENGIRNSEPGVLEKANPYYRPKSIMEFQKDIQMDLEKLKTGENLAGDQPSKEGITSPGRPPNLKDTKVRDKRTPIVLSVHKAVAEEYLDSIDTIIDPLFLSSNKVKNIRSLSKEKKNELHNVKMAILSNISLGDIVSEDLIKQRLSNPDKNKADRFFRYLDDLVNVYLNDVGKYPSSREIRSLVTSCWSFMVGN